MDIQFSRHSKNNMRLYKIDPKDVLEAINNADKLETERGKKIALKKFEGKYTGFPLKVVYKVEQETIFVITVYPFKKKAWR